MIAQILSTFNVMASQLSAALPNIGNHVVINQKLSAFGMHFPFQRFVTNGLLLVKSL